LENLGSFLGRFHPIWVHLPIGILVLLGAMEFLGLLARWRRISWWPALAERQRTLILVFAAFASVLAAFLGWLLAGHGEYDAELVDRHQTLGFYLAGASVLLLLVHRRRWLYAPVLAATLVLLTFAAHAGAKLTHGSDYLVTYMPPALARMLGVTIPAPAAKPVPVTFERAEAYANVVQPILQERCVSCHGPTKSNGGLRLDSWAMVAKGGKHGRVFKPGDLTGSALVRRVDLPADVKEHMPPKGKPQLVDDDLTVLEWWVGAGAPHDKLLTALDLPPSVQEILQGRFGGGSAEIPPDRSATLAQAAEIAEQLGLIIRPRGADGPWLDVNARILGKAFGDRELAQLAPIAPAVQWLDLGTTAITDAGLAALQPMRHLERLHLDQSGVTDAGLARLSALKKLAYLNLRGTAVTDHGLVALRVLPRLRALYVWQTAVTPAAVQELGEALTDHRKIARWTAEQEVLGREIQGEHFTGNTGESLRPPIQPASATPPPAPTKSPP
jgi:uncharacterized membrane protein/mono/diheme cytochrome c family protein